MTNLNTIKIIEVSALNYIQHHIAMMDMYELTECTGGYWYDEFKEYAHTRTNLTDDQINAIPDDILGDTCDKHYSECVDALAVHWYNKLVDKLNSNEIVRHSSLSADDLYEPDEYPLNQWVYEWGGDIAENAEKQVLHLFDLTNRIKKIKHDTVDCGIVTDIIPMGTKKLTHR